MGTAFKYVKRGRWPVIPQFQEHRMRGKWPNLSQERSGKEGFHKCLRALEWAPVELLYNKAGLPREKTCWRRGGVEALACLQSTIPHPKSQLSWLPGAQASFQMTSEWPQPGQWEHLCFSLVGLFLHDLSSHFLVDVFTIQSTANACKFFGTW